jgi:UDP-glucose 4-epimerase
MALTTEHPNTIYNLGFGQGTTVNQIFDTLKKVTAFGLPAKFGPAKLGETRRIYLDASKARESLGWEPLVNLEEGLERTVAYFRRSEAIS